MNLFGSCRSIIIPGQHSSALAFAWSTCLLWWVNARLGSVWTGSVQFCHFCDADLMLVSSAAYLTFWRSAFLKDTSRVVCCSRSTCYLSRTSSTVFGVSLSQYAATSYVHFVLIDMRYHILLLLMCWHFMCLYLCLSLSLSMCIKHKH